MGCAAEFLKVNACVTAHPHDRSSVVAQGNSDGRIAVQANTVLSELSWMVEGNDSALPSVVLPAAQSESAAVRPCANPRAEALAPAAKALAAAAETRRGRTAALPSWRDSDCGG